MSDIPTSEGKIAQVWTPEEDAVLRQVVGSAKKRNWKAIAMTGFGQSKTQSACQQRWEELQVWTSQEDALLADTINKVGAKNFSLIASHLVGRDPKMCRDRWLNELVPRFSRSEWTQEEDDTLLQAYAELGNAWSKIAARLSFRSEDAVKARFNLTLRARPGAKNQGLLSKSSTQASWTAFPVDCLVNTMKFLSAGFALWAHLRTVCKAWHTLSTNEQWLGMLQGVVKTLQAVQPVSSLVGLQVLSVDARDADVRFLSSLTSLRSLDVVNLKFNKESGKVMSRLAMLQRLSLRSCQGIFSFAGFHALRELQLFGCDVTDKGLASVGQLAGLRQLGLAGCFQISDEGIRYLSTLTALEDLNLSVTNVSMKVLEVLQPLTHLQHLCMKQVLIGDVGCQYLSSLQKLQSLDAQLRITDAGLAHFTALSCLECLEMSGASITNEGMFILAKLRSLRSLTLDANRYYDDIGCLSSLKQLQILDASNCPFLASVSLLVSLTHLKLRRTYMHNLDISSVVALKNLQELDLYYNNSLTDDGVALLASLTNLTKLNLTHTDVRGVGLKGLTSLQMLEMRSCPLTDDGYKVLASLPLLRELDISDIYNGSPRVFSLSSLENFRRGAIYRRKFAGD